MDFTILKYALTIITIQYKLLSSEAENQTNQSYRILSRQERAPGNIIKLRQFIHAVTYFRTGCSWPCTAVRDLNSAIDYGCLNSGPDSLKHECPPEFWILNWEEDDLGYTENRTDCPTAPASMGTFNCLPCTCINRYFDGTAEADSINTFSLLKQESNFALNKVVTGVRYILHKKIIHLQIQEAELRQDGRVDKSRTWKEIGGSATLIKSSSDSVKTWGLEPVKDYLKFEPFTRTMYIDDIYLPNNYILTGAKFSEIGETARRNGIKLEIKGTKFDDHFHLLKGTDEWFDFSKSADNRVKYSDKRMEIDLSNCDASEPTSSDKPLPHSFYYVRFRATKDYANEDARPAIPYISGDPATSEDDLPLRGLALSWKGRKNYGGYIIARTIPATSPIPTVIESAVNVVVAKNGNKPVPKIDVKIYRLRTQAENVSCTGNIDSNQSQAESVDYEDDMFLVLYKTKNTGASFKCRLLSNIIFLSIMFLL